MPSQKSRTASLQPQAPLTLRLQCLKALLERSGVCSSTPRWCTRLTAWQFSASFYISLRVRPEWKMSSVVDEQVGLIKEQVGDARVICGLSGGVDSSVAAALVHRAIGAQLTCVYVDTGLMRKGRANRWSRHSDATWVSNLFMLTQGNGFLSASREYLSPRQNAKRLASSSSVFLKSTPEACRKQSS